MQLRRLIQKRINDTQPVKKKLPAGARNNSPEERKRKDQAADTYQTATVSNAHWVDVGFLPANKGLADALMDLDLTEPGECFRVIEIQGSLDLLETHEPPRQVIVRPVVEITPIVKIELNRIDRLSDEADYYDDCIEEEDEKEGPAAKALRELASTYCPDFDVDSSDNWNEVGERIKLAIRTTGLKA